MPHHWTLRGARALCIACLAVSVGAFAIDVTTATQTNIEQLPITGIHKVTMSDGTVKFLSEDRRFVFVGTMHDLWNGGTLEAGVPLDSKVNLSRNGIEVNRMGFSLRGPVNENPVLFVAPDCEDCAELLKMVFALEKINISVVLLATTQTQHRMNAFVWCSNDRAKSLEMVYIGNQLPKRADMNEECDRLGLMLAGEAAKLFGIAQLPMMVSKEGNGYVGVDAIEQLIKVIGDQT